MKGTRFLTAFFLGLVLLMAVGCQRGKQKKQHDLDLALVLKTLNNPYFIDLQKGAEETASERGVSLIVQAAEREVDVEKQMQIIENLIERNVSAIIVSPSGSREIIPAILKANERQIPVLVIDTQVDMATLEEAGGKIATFIGSDNFEGGRIAGRFIVNLLGGKGDVAILEGIPGHETGDQRLSGFHDVIDKEDGIRIVASQTANWERDQGFNVFQNILKSCRNIDALFCCNDMMALGAIEAIAAEGKGNDLIVIGFDAIKDGREAIRKGTMTGSIAQHPYEMGKLAVENAVKQLSGEEIPDYIPVTIELITRESLE
ncbi:MAG: substrate-binding domain-containing protein [bacterium]